MTFDKFVTVYKACGQPEAEIVKGRLEVEGIPVILKYESLGNVYGLTVDGLGQVQVQVPEGYSEQAKGIVSGSCEPDDSE